jgi:GNAT superfamily N-acetyltransferase
MTGDRRRPVVALAVDAWAPVFAGFEAVMAQRAYRLVHPDWRTAQAAAVARVSLTEDLDVWVADVGGTPVGFVAVPWTEEGATPVGEVEMIAVAPSHQRAGIVSRLLDRAVAEIAERGVPLAVIGTGGDPGTRRPASCTSGTGSPASRWCAPTGPCSSSE